MPPGVATLQLSEMTWQAVRELPPERTVALLPVGATEAHGPHLPLNTDVLISTAMARRAAERLAEQQVQAVLLPPVAYSVAEWGGAFAGTLSISPEIATAWLIDVARAVRRHGFRCLALANAHLEPAHIGTLKAAVGALAGEEGCPVVFPDVTRRRLAERLSDEFRSGACHAGRYEGSVVLAERPELVDEAARASLSPNPSSLLDAIRAGAQDFVAAGGPQAYFGDPAAATAQEGRQTIDSLGAILEEAVLEAL